MALGYSRQLSNLHFFSHTSPISGTFTNRVDRNPAIANHYSLAAENLAGAASNNGCIGSAKSVIMEVDPATGDESPGYKPPYAPPANTAGFPCYEHNTLADVLESAGVSWRYYTGAEGSLWSAPSISK